MSERAQALVAQLMQLSPTERAQVGRALYEQAEVELVRAVDAAVASGQMRLYSRAESDELCSGAAPSTSN